MGDTFYIQHFKEEITHDIYIFPSMVIPSCMNPVNFVKVLGLIRKKIKGSASSSE